MRYTRKTLLGVPLPEAPVSRTCDSNASKYINELEKALGALEAIFYTDKPIITPVVSPDYEKFDVRLRNIEKGILDLVQTVSPAKNPCVDISIPDRTEERFTKLRENVAHLASQMYLVRDALGKLGYRIN